MQSPCMGAISLHAIPLHGRNPLHACNTLAGTVDVLYTLEVEWRPSAVNWSSRWDLYLELTDPNMHLYSTINSLVIVFFLSGLS